MSRVKNIWRKCPVPGRCNSVFTGYYEESACMLSGWNYTVVRCIATGQQIFNNKKNKTFKVRNTHPRFSKDNKRVLFYMLYPDGKAYAVTDLLTHLPTPRNLKMIKDWVVKKVESELPFEIENIAQIYDYDD